MPSFEKKMPCTGCRNMISSLEVLVNSTRMSISVRSEKWFYWFHTREPRAGCAWPKPWLTGASLRWCWPRPSPRRPWHLRPTEPSSQEPPRPQCNYPALWSTKWPRPSLDPVWRCVDFNLLNDISFTIRTKKKMGSYISPLSCCFSQHFILFFFLLYDPFLLFCWYNLRFECWYLLQNNYGWHIFCSMKYLWHFLSVLNYI